MTLNKICVIGILFYILPIITHYSNRALIIFINGILYHGFLAGNMKMLFIDYLCNFLISLYTAYFYPNTFLPGLFCVFLNLINQISYYKYKFNKKIVDIIHVLTVHLPFLYLIYITS